MRLVAYLPGADYKVRMEEEIEDEDYLTRPEFYKSSLRQKLISEFGTGRTKAGLRWEWSPQIKAQTTVDVLEEPRIRLPPVPVPEEEEIRRVTESYIRGKRLAGLEQYWAEYRRLRVEEGLSQEEARRRLRETRF